MQLMTASTPSNKPVRLPGAKTSPRDGREPFSRIQALWMTRDGGHAVALCERLAHDGAAGRAGGIGYGDLHPVSPLRSSAPFTTIRIASAILSR